MSEDKDYDFSNDESSDEEDSSKDHDLSAQECFAQPKRSTKKNNDEVLLDSGSTISIFKDKHLVENIRTAKNKLMLYTNAGKKIISKEADIPGYGSVFYDKEAITNIFALKDLITQG